MRTLLIDLETKSDLPLGGPQGVGLFRYMDDPSFGVLLFGYSVDNGPVQVVDLTAGETVPEDILRAVSDPKVLKAAWNCAFERYGIWKQFGISCPPENWIDIMIIAANCGLPLKLEECCTALHMPEDKTKLRIGADLIREFCCPVKPAKKWGMKNHVTPDMDPENWALFKQYNQRDVETEDYIWLLLAKWTPDETEHRFWCLDQRINDLGMRVDRELVLNATRMDTIYKEELADTAIALTGMDNPNSTSQVKDWLLEQEGLEVPTLNKKAVADVVAQLQTDRAKAFMAIRTELSKTSTKKYDAFMRYSSDENPHARGCFQFFGAHSGRFSGRGVQLQNLPGNTLPDLEEARALAKSNDYETLKLLYPVTDTLSQLIRTALIPEPGCRFVVSDFSAIEARVSAWIAGEEETLEEFRNEGLIYEKTASMMFHVPKNDIRKGGPREDLRKKGKIATLACIAEGQPVLTDQGLVPIEKVTTAMRVWDGENWVHHEGLIDRGEKEVITYDGLSATPDHHVYIEGESRPVRFDYAASSGKRLLHPRYPRKSLRECGSDIPGKALEQELEPLLCSDSVPGMRINSMDGSRESKDGKIQGLSKMLDVGETVSHMAGEKSNHSTAEMHEPEGPAIQELRGPGNHLRLSLSPRGLPVGSQQSGDSGTKAGDRSNRQQQGLRSRESSMGNSKTKYVEPKEHANTTLEPGRLAVCSFNGSAVSGFRDVPGRDTGTGQKCGERKAQELESHKGLVRTYDLLNAGPRHRFTVSGVIVSNCGYGGGVNSLLAFGADKMGMTPEEMVQTVDLWRSANPHIVLMWAALDRAMSRCIAHHATTVSKIGGIRFRWEDNLVWMRLPSGREMAYFEPRYAESTRTPGKMTISYMGIAQKNHKWSRIETWGGRVFENLVQATARDCLRETMMKLDEQGWDIRGHVHDEIICSEPIEGRPVEDMEAVFSNPIPWAPGLPLRGDGYETPWYKKD